MDNLKEKEKVDDPVESKKKQKKNETNFSYR